jgi:flagellar biogenesis protein FliO
MRRLPHTSETAIAITFLVMNLSALLRQVFCLFYVLNKIRYFSGFKHDKTLSLRENKAENIYVA